MRTQIENNILTIFLEGRIDTNNAPAVEAELLAQAEQNPGADVVLDAEKLEYISSAGLRVLMKLRKQLGKPLTVENVSREPILDPYARMMYFTSSIAHPMLPAQYRTAYVQQMRELVFPHAEEMLNSMKCTSIC